MKPITTTQVQHGYRPSGGKVSIVSDRSAAEGYMSAEQYARIRARSTGGTYVRRTVVIITTAGDWETPS